MTRARACQKKNKIKNKREEEEEVRSNKTEHNMQTTYTKIKLNKQLSIIWLIDFEILKRRR